MKSKQEVKPVLEDSPAWSRDAHNEGLKHLAKHSGDGGATSADLMKLGRMLFDVYDDSLSNLRELQTMIRTEFGERSGGKGPPTSQEAVDRINTWLEGKFKITLSHAQMVCLWHVLVDQEDLQLLRPWPADRNW